MFFLPKKSHPTFTLHLSCKEFVQKILKMHQFIHLSPFQGTKLAAEQLVGNQGKCQEGQNSAYFRPSGKAFSSSQIPSSQLGGLEKIQVTPMGRGRGPALLPAIKASAARPSAWLIWWCLRSWHAGREETAGDPQAGSVQTGGNAGGRRKGT